MKNWIGFVAAMLVAVGLGILGTTPPRPLPADAAQTEFSASRAMAHVRRVAARPHPTGSAENAAVRSYIAEQLRGLGLEVREAEAALPQAAIDRMALLSKGALVPEKLVNVIGVLPGKNRAAPAVALMTHHDTVWGSPGAADDTAGVATILETLRAIKASGQPARDLVVVITDAEELGLSGAEAFFAADPLRGRIGTIINLEARGGGGRTTMFETSPGNGEAMRLFAGSVSRPGASSLAAYVYSVLPNDTDMSVSMRGGWPGYNFAFIGRPGLYHSPKATPDRLDQGALQDMGGQVLALTNALLTAERLPERAANATFFDFFSLFLVIYPQWLGWVMLAASAAMLGWSGRKIGLRTLSAGMGRMLGLIAASGVALFVFNWISGAGPSAEYYDRLAAIPKLEAMALLAGLGTFLLIYGPAPASKPQQAGAAALLGLLGLGAQIVAPTAAYIFVVPVLIAALGMWLGRWAGLSGAALVAGYMIYLGHFVMQGVGAPMAYVAAMPLALAVMASLPVWPGLGEKVARSSAAVLLGLALGMALWVRLDPVADTVAAYSSDKSVEAIPITKPK